MQPSKNQDKNLLLYLRYPAKWIQAVGCSGPNSSSYTPTVVTHGTL